MSDVSTGVAIGGGPYATDAVKVTERVLKQVQEDADMLRRMKAQQHHLRTSQFGKAANDDELETLRHVDDLVSSATATKAITDAWRAEGRQVLAMHPDLMHALHTAQSDPIVGEVLRTLPYINPLVIFGDPPIVFQAERVTSWFMDKPQYDQQFQLLGFFTFGKTFYGHLTTTHDPEAVMLGCMMLIAVLDADGQQVDWEFDKISIPFDSRTMTIKEWGAILSNRFKWDTQLGTELEKEQIGAQFLTTVVGHLLGALLYLCSTTIDAEVIPKKAAAKIGRGLVRKPIRFTRVGWKLGPALTRYRKEIKHERQYGPVSVQPPHQRRAHFQVYWTGKGRTVPKLYFIPPVWINRHLLDTDGIRTVRPVPKVD